MQPGLTWHVELEIESGATYREILVEAARALRTAALQLEGGRLDTGHHPIMTLSGKKIGEVYIDYYGMGER